MTTLKLTFITPDGGRVKISVPVRIDEDTLNHLGEHVIVPFNGVEDAVLSID